MQKQQRWTTAGAAGPLPLLKGCWGLPAQPHVNSDVPWSVLICLIKFLAPVEYKQHLTVSYWSAVIEGLQRGPLVNPHANPVVEHSQQFEQLVYLLLGAAQCLPLPWSVLICLIKFLAPDEYKPHWSHFRGYRKGRGKIESHWANGSGNWQIKKTRHRIITDIMKAYRKYCAVVQEGSGTIFE